MSGHKTSAARYRRYAQQCLEMAQVVTANQARTAFVQMAQVWQRLADQHERSRSAPRFQQQQQVQPKVEKE